MRWEYRNSEEELAICPELDDKRLDGQPVQCRLPGYRSPSPDALSMGGYMHNQNTRINTKGCSRCKHTKSICNMLCSVTPHLICLTRLKVISSDIASTAVGCGSIASLWTHGM